MFSISRSVLTALAWPVALPATTLVVALPATTLVVALFATTATASAKTVVIKSIGPSAAAYPRGMVLPAMARIKLLAYDSITLLDADGTRSFIGPLSISFPLPRNRYQSRPLLDRFFRAIQPYEVFAALLRSTPRQPRKLPRGPGGGGADSAAPGATQVPAPPARVERSQNLWLIDPAEQGNFCLPSAKAATLINRNPAGKALTIRSAGDAAQSVAVGQVNTYGVAWPVDRLPIRSGDSYIVEGGFQGPSTVRLIILDMPPVEGQDPSDIAVRLVEQGCANQLERMATNAPAAGPQ